MADIELVIKIPKEVYETLRETYVILGGQRHRGGETPMSIIYDAVVNGTPLPKGHGDLKDVNDIVKLFDSDDRLWWSNAVEELTDANVIPTIIEADTESEG